MIKPIYELEPLIESFKEVGIEDYIKTRDFKNAISLSDYKDLWLLNINHLKDDDYIPSTDVTQSRVEGQGDRPDRRSRMLRRTPQNSVFLSPLIRQQKFWP